MSTETKRPLGTILVQRNLLNEQQLEHALREQRRKRDSVRLASRLINLGMITEVDALRGLSEQHGVPGIDMMQVAILLEHLELVPRDIAESHKILPVLVKQDRLFLAMANPTDKRVIDEIEFVTGKKVYPYIALDTTLAKAITAAYDARAQNETYYLGPDVPAETLKQLGLGAPTERVRIAAPRAPVPSEHPPVIVDDVMERAGAEAEISVADFGTLDAEISSVAALPDEFQQRAERAAATVSGSGKLILVVDDEEDIRKLLRRLLTEKGFRVIEADRGLLALRLVKEHVPDLIVLDAMLPEIHGFDIARRIKGSGKYGNIPIVMISAVYRGWRIAEDLKSGYGIEEYIEKPFRIGDVLAAIQRAFAQTGKASAKSSVPARDPEAINREAENALTQGIAAYKAGKVDIAITHLKRGVDLDPLAYRLHFHLALLYGKKGLVYEGIQALERAVDLNAKHFPALKNLAVLYEKAGFKHKAIEMWERCLQTAPDPATRDSIKERLLKLL